jgi:hypothetical protein
MLVICYTFTIASNRNLTRIQSYDQDSILRSSAHESSTSSQELNWICRIEVLTAVGMESSILLDIMPYGSLKVNWRFGGTLRLYHQGIRISQARNQHESSVCHLLLRWFLSWLIRPWKCRRHIPPKCRSSFSGLHGVIFRKTELVKWIWLPHYRLSRH